VASSTPSVVALVPTAGQLAPVLAVRDVDLVGEGEFRITLSDVLRVHQSALKHGCSIEDISHAYDLALYDAMIDEDNDPPKRLIIGPDGAGNLLELIGGDIADDVLLIWHAKKCQAAYFKLLPMGGEV